MGVTSNAISPGFVWTPLAEKQLPDLARSKGITIEEAKKEMCWPTSRRIASSRWRRSARWPLFLASEDAKPRSRAPTTPSTAGGPRNRPSSLKNSRRSD